MEKNMYAVYRDGFRISGFVTLEQARVSLAHHSKTDNFYQIAIYCQNADGSLSYVE